MKKDADQQTLNHHSANHSEYCVLIPTYNNDQTLKDVVLRVQSITNDIIIINDGSTDKTSEILASFKNITLINHETNFGKGKALSSGFEEAINQGYKYAISIDSDGQHYPEDIPLFLERMNQIPNHLLIGARQLKEAGQPGKNSFANKISNFWFTVETGLNLPDTQSGFRMYPLNKIKNLNLKTAHYDYELEILVKSFWKGIKIESVPIRVYYPPQGERVSHFKPIKDFARISLLNVRLVLLALFYYRPLIALRSLSPKNIRKTFKTAFNNPKESILHKCNSVALGIFFGIVPIWGYQLLLAVLVAYALKLNKTIVILTAQISFPPMIPIILFLSIKTGEIFTGEKSNFSFSNITKDIVTQNLTVYIVGACILAVIASVMFWFISYILLKKFNKVNPPS
jgi:glycosyltransferase involved in cell wall biosynthesis